MTSLSLDSLKVGDTYAETITFDRRATERFGRLTMDRSGIHRDRAFSASKGYEDLVVHGLLLSLPFSCILGMELPGDGAVIGSVDFNFHRPAYHDEALTYRVEVTRIIPALGSALLGLTVHKPDGSPCLRGHANCVFR